VVTPIASTLVSLALSAMYHKNSSLRAAALETLTNLVYFVPEDVLAPLLRRFYEAMEASNSVHQISSSIRCLSGTCTGCPSLQACCTLAHTAWAAR
jgi:hypothetical protein